MSSKANEPDEAELALLNDDSLSTTSDDLESNRKHEATPDTIDPEYQTPTSVKFMWLGSYFLFSMLLTLYNKLLLGSVSMALNMMGLKY
ncbi:Drug/metabolite transporter [Penicillium concentricum]|uniref:Drug/metabolite transporter n=1 Tax=Penicillium concentricum TaxID=293559 RepID=A0A9W9S847_9EURO|nr:Drug/metabolite transporter [Penicillium concentricum]KAJ5373713.1 Drug/metabolite transporter [Penicillium concentricum]